MSERRHVALVVLLLLDLLVIGCLGLFTDPPTVELMSRDVESWLADRGLSVGQGSSVLVQGVIYAVLFTPFGATLALWSPRTRVEWLSALAVLLVVALALSGAGSEVVSAWGAVAGAAAGVGLGAVVTRPSASAGARRTTHRQGVGSTLAQWVVGVTALAAVAATTVVTVERLMVPYLTQDDQPLSTTPVQEARETAKSKELAVGLSYGGRLQYMDGAELERALDDAVALGATWVRTDLEWGVVQADGPDSYDWSGFDEIVAEVNERGLKLMPLLLAAPEWAREESCVEDWACPPRDIVDFVDFAGVAAERYSRRGVTTWEIWNEPNIPAFWVDPDPDKYAALLSGAVGVIRAVDDDARIVMGGLAALDPNGGTRIEARDFLARVCDAGGCEGIDAVAYHPYTFPWQPSEPGSDDGPWLRMSDTDYSLAGVLRDNGLRDVPIWVTEFGAPTGGPGTAADSPGGDPFAEHVTERRQAEIAFDSVITSVVHPDVEALFWYTDVDLPERAGREAHFGLRRADGTKKPAFAALKRAIGIAAP